MFTFNQTRVLILVSLPSGKRSTDKFGGYCQSLIERITQILFRNIEENDRFDNLSGVVALNACRDHVSSLEVGVKGVEQDFISLSAPKCVAIARTVSPVST